MGCDGQLLIENPGHGGFGDTLPTAFCRVASRLGFSVP